MRVRDYVDSARLIIQIGKEEGLKRREIETLLLVGEIDFPGRKDVIEHFGGSLRSVAFSMQKLRARGLIGDGWYKLTDEGRKIYDRINQPARIQEAYEPQMPATQLP